MLANLHVNSAHAAVIKSNEADDDLLKHITLFVVSDVNKSVNW